MIFAYKLERRFMDYKSCDFDVTGIDKVTINANCFSNQISGTFHACDFTVKPGRMGIPKASLNHALIWGIIEGIGKENVTFIGNLDIDHPYEGCNLDHFYQQINKSSQTEIQEVVTHVTHPILAAKAADSTFCTCCIL